MFVAHHEDTRDLIPLLNPWTSRAWVRLLLAFLASQVILSQLASRFEAFDLGTSEPSFEATFARSRSRPPSEAPSAEQHDNEVRLLDFLAQRSSAWMNDAEALEDLARATAFVRKEARLQPVTAVVLSWKRRRGLGIVLRHLASTPFIREIIVWNNNIDVYLDTQDLERDMMLPEGLIKPALRIVNGPSNLHDIAKHYACSLATYEHCYLNDDDWLNPSIDSSYAKYIDDGAHRIVTNTMPYIAWCVRNYTLLTLQGVSTMALCQRRR